MFVEEEQAILEIFNHPNGEDYGWVPDEHIYGTYLKYKGLWNEEAEDKLTTYLKWGWRGQGVVVIRELSKEDLDNYRLSGAYFARKAVNLETFITSDLLYDITVKR